MNQLANNVPDESMNFSIALQAITQLITSTNYTNASGNADFWLCVTKNFTRLGQGCGLALENLIRSVDDPLFSVCLTYVQQLKNMDAKGKGDVYYWLERAKNTSKQMDDIGVALMYIAKKL